MLSPLLKEIAVPNYIVYHVASTRYEKAFETLGGAKRSATALNKRRRRAAARNYNELDADDRFEVCTRKTWDEDINTWTTTYNMLDAERKPIAIRKADKGTCCDPATNRYHEM